MFYYVKVDEDNNFINLEDEISVARMLKTGWQSEDALEQSLAGDGFFMLDIRSKDLPPECESIWASLDDDTRYAIVKR